MNLWTLWRKLLVVLGRILGGLLFFTMVSVIAITMIQDPPSHINGVGYLNAKQQQLVEMSMIGSVLLIGPIGLLFLLLSENLSVSME